MFPTIGEVSFGSVPPAAHTPAYGEVDLTTCDREPIHIPGAIQPHGVLLALDERLQVVAASANTALLLGAEVESLVGGPVAAVLGDDLAAAVGRSGSHDRGADLFEARMPVDASHSGGLAGRRVDVRTHRSGDRLVVEIEGKDEALRDSSLRTSHRAMGRLAATVGVFGLADRLAREVRSVLGFDRVMVYRFDPEWNGEVIAEDRREDLNPFLGLHYPATDIPAQARRLYTVNWTRLIADIAYTPVPLHPILDPGTGAPLDLSHSSLRSVSPIHIEYLGHMGVTASMSVSIVVNEQLWGLVACHHYSGPHRPPQDARAAAELLGQVASQMFFDREQTERREDGLAVRSTLSDLTTRVAAETGDPLPVVMAAAELPRLVDAQGVAMCFDGVVTTVGTVPDEAVLRHVAALLESPDEYVTSSNRLSDLDAGLEELAGTAAGALRIGSAPDRWLLWLRPELEQFVDWGGDPTNKLLAAQEGPHVRLSPRRSFEKWRQVVRGSSKPWTTAQREAADELGRYLTGVLLARSSEHIAMAESMQRSVMLDRAPQLAGLDLAATYRPASAFQMGGDWWDAFELGDGRVAFVVGDIAGHGVLAASAMVQLRSTLRAFLFEGHGPAQALDHLDALMDHLLPEQLASAAVVVLDRGSGRAEVASAGHPPLLLVDEDGARFLEVEPRPLLGVGLRQGDHDRQGVDLAPGQTLLLYTDGLVERRGVDIDLSLDRLRSVSMQHPTADLDTWVEALALDLGVTQDDDTTLLAFRRPVSG